MTQGSTNSTRKKTLQNNNNGTTKARHTDNKTMKGKTVSSMDSSTGKENKDGGCMEQRGNDSTDGMTMSPVADSGGDTLTEMEGIRPLNGHNAFVDPKDKRSKFIKQQSEASSSGATAETNMMYDSMMTNESSLANKSMVNSISVQTDQSAGGQSKLSGTSDVSASMIQVRVHLNMILR